MAELETERLRIREVLASDVDVFLRYMQEERYWRDVPVEPPTTAWVAALLDRSLASRAKKIREQIISWLSLTSFRASS
jgi:hypothetical protein